MYKIHNYFLEGLKRDISGAFTVGSLFPFYLPGSAQLLLGGHLQDTLYL